MSIINNERQSSYRSIFKTTSLFGGVQLYQILINIIKSKFIAILLGPNGIGIQGLYLSALQLIQSVASMGIEKSAVRDISEANSSDDNKKISLIVTVLRKLVWYTGILGTVAVILLSPFLSKMTFGNYDYTIPFIILSLTLLIDQLSNGQKVLLQGLRKLTYLAKASALGSTVGLIVSIPLYYLFGIKGIVPTLVLTSFFNLVSSWFFSKKIKIEPIGVSFKQSLKEGKTMLHFGIVMSFTGMLSLVFSYILRSYIRHSGGIEQVGLFTAGYTIINTYVGMIFNAMSTDYYPRLASINKDNMKCKEVVNQQSEVATLIMSPLLLICLVFMPLIVSLLYSHTFVDSIDYIIWSSIGMMFRMGAWAIAFQFVAKAESKLFLINEFSGCTINFICSVIGYYLYGLAGLGIGFTVGYLFYFIQVYIIAQNRYNFSFSYILIRTFLLQLFLLIMCLLCTLFFKGTYMYISGCSLIVLSSFISIRGLERRMAIFSVFKEKYRK